MLNGRFKLVCCGPNNADCLARFLDDEYESINEAIAAGNVEQNVRIRELAAKLRSYELAGKALKHFLTEAQ